MCNDGLLSKVFENLFYKELDPKLIQNSGDITVDESTILKDADFSAMSTTPIEELLNLNVSQERPVSAYIHIDKKFERFKQKFNK